MFLSIYLVDFLKGINLHITALNAATPYVVINNSYNVDFSLDLSYCKVLLVTASRVPL